MAPKMVDHEQRRIDIARATFVAVKNHGVENLTLRDIAVEAGFTTGVFSHYFKDKNSVLRYAFKIAYQDTYDRIAKANKSVESNLVKIKNSMVEVLPDPEKLESVAFVAMCFGIRKSGDLLLENEYNANKDEYRRLLEGYINSAIKEGEIPNDGETSEIVDLIFAVEDGVCIQALLNPVVYTRDRCIRILDSLLERLILSPI